MRSARMWGTGLGVALVLFAAGCAAPEPGPAERLPAPVAALPAEELTVLGDATDAGIEASAALFERTPVVVLAGTHSELPAASVAVALGVPLLSAATDPDALTAELDRLGADHIVVLGAPPDDEVLENRTVIQV
ncbi:MAG: hypothetical protein M3116_06765, partial [Actinomycetota bacterium]|nr:hypothetical protein [Actinomycetota bacterium]